MRPQAFRTYLDATRASLRAHVVSDPNTGLFLDALDEMSDDDIARCFAERDWPGKRNFQNDPVLAQALNDIPDDNQMGQTLRDIAEYLDWSAVFHGPEAPKDLSDFMHVAALTFRPHTDAVPGVHAGIFVLHPNLDYPLHTHLANEIYICLSGALTIKHGVAEVPHALSPGGYSVTPSERLHSLHTGTEPVILSYIWRGNLSAPNWWWHKDSAGNWMREHWQWEDDHEWRSYGVEPVTPEIMARCNP